MQREADHLPLGGMIRSAYCRDSWAEFCKLMGLLELLWTCARARSTALDFLTHAFPLLATVQLYVCKIRFKIPRQQ